MHRATNFILMQCQPKILQRFTIVLHPFSKRHYCQVFDTESVTSDALREGFVHMSKPDLGKAHFDEKKFLQVFINGIL